MQGLPLRMVSAAVMLAVAGIALYLGGVALEILGAAAYIAINFEFLTFAVKSSARERLILLGLSAVPPLAFLCGGWEWFGRAMLLAEVLVIGGSVLVIEHRRHERELEQILFPLLLWVSYPILFGSMLFGVISEAGASATPRIIWLLAIVIFSDSCAYFGGRAIGGRKLAPRISPNKTVAGSVCGFIGGIIAGWVAAYYLGLFPGSHQFLGLVYAVIACILAQLGDLVESMVKRIFGVKDSGNLIPGHGGVFDRIDALLFAFPVLFLF